MINKIKNVIANSIKYIKYKKLSYTIKKNELFNVMKELEELEDNKNMFVIELLGNKILKGAKFNRIEPVLNEDQGYVRYCWRKGDTKVACLVKN